MENVREFDEVDETLQATNSILLDNLDTSTPNEFHKDIELWNIDFGRRERKYCS